MLPMGELSRMTQFKNLSKKYGSSVSAGLFAYPALMAADILIYKSNVVPVGEDQQQHIELTREIARKFNKRFGQTFPIPKAILPKTGERLKSLIDPTKKMSKSDAPESYIGLFDKPADIERKIKHAVTDSGREIKYNPKNKPALSNLLTIYSLVSGKPVKALEKQFSGKGYAEFKKLLAQEVNKFLEPFRKRRARIKEKEALKILEAGRKKASVLAADTLKEVKEKTGLLA
jgi:tryptophanyl-tRNA synthetase